MKIKFLAVIGFILMPVFIYADTYNVEFTLKTYSNGNYDIIYYYNYKQIVKQIFKNDVMTDSTGIFPDGTVNFVNFNNVPVAKVNIKDGKYDGECIFYREMYTVRSLYSLNPDTGKIVSFYKKGVLDGITKIFDREGRVVFELNYSDGILNGISYFYDYILMKKNIAEFKNGEKVKEESKILISENK